MKRLGVIVLCAALAGIFLASHHVAAESLKIAPLKYQTSLQKGEIKKGFVDISNPDYQQVTVTLTVQAFRQTADDGSLKFYDSAQVSSGVELDLKTITLAPRQAMRVYFLLDGAKLPSGDVFAAIFASTTPKTSSGTSQSVRVGTLLFITNGTPVAHTADITKFSMRWFQFGGGLHADITVHNPANAQMATGFFPDITVATEPYSSKTVQGPLLFAGMTRDVNYYQAGSYFGPLFIKVRSNGQSSSQWVFAVTGYWRVVAPCIALAMMVGLWILGHRFRANYHKRYRLRNKL